MKQITIIGFFFFFSLTSLVLAASITPTHFERRLEDLQIGTTRTSIIDHIRAVQKQMEKQKLHGGLQFLPEGVHPHILTQDAEKVYSQYIESGKLTANQLFQAIQRQKQADLIYVEEAQQKIRQIKQLDAISRTDPVNQELEVAKKAYIAELNRLKAEDTTLLPDDTSLEKISRIRLTKELKNSTSYKEFMLKKEEVERNKTARAAEKAAKEKELNDFLTNPSTLGFEKEKITSLTLDDKRNWLEAIQSNYATLSKDPNFKALQKGTQDEVKNLAIEKAKMPLFTLQGQRQIEHNKTKLFEMFAGLTGKDRETLSYDATTFQDDVGILNEVSDFLGGEIAASSSTPRNDWENKLTMTKEKRTNLLTHAEELRSKAKEIDSRLHGHDGEAGVSDPVERVKLERQSALLDRRAKLFEEAGSHLMNEDVAPGAQTVQEVNKEIQKEKKALAKDKKESGALMATLILPETTQQTRQKELLAGRQKRLAQEQDPDSQVNKIDWAALCENEDNSSQFFNPEMWQGMLGFAGAASYIVSQRRLYEKGSRDATFHATRALAVVGSSFLMDEPQDPAKTFMRQPVDAAIIPNQQLGQMFGVGGNPGTFTGSAQQALEPSQRLALATQLRGMGYDITNPDVQKFFGLSTNGMAPQGTQNILGFNPLTPAISGTQFGQNQVLSPTQGKQGFGNFIRNISAMQQSANGYNREMANHMPYRANNTFAEAVRSASRAQGVVAGFDTAASNVQGLEDRAGFVTPDAQGNVSAAVLTDPLVAIQSADLQIQDKIQELLRQVYPVQLEYYKASEDLSIGPDGLMIGSYKPSEMRKNMNRRNAAYFQLIRMKTEIDKLRELRSMLPNSPEIAQRIMQGGIAITSFLENIQEFFFFKTAFALQKQENIYDKVLPYVLNQDTQGLKKLLRNYTLVPNWRSILREEKKRINEMKELTIKQLQKTKEELKNLMKYEQKDIHEMSYREIKYEEMNFRAITSQTEQNILLLKKMDEDIENKNWTTPEKQSAHADIEGFRKLVLETREKAQAAAQSFSDMHDFQLQFVLGLEERSLYEEMAQEILK
ncbi:MAG: hypothetical protein HYW47_05710 [Deltaproteobacteria bacterium]|nr:hypothetical protein [Deltaproteobacteria bacterium]